MKTSHCAVAAVENYRKLLFAKRSELLAGCTAKFDALAQAGQLPRADQAVVLHDEFVAMKWSGVARETLGLIDAALRRLDAGDYGVCVACGKAIPAKRLKVVPWAGRCLACEDRDNRCRGSTQPAGRAA